MPSERHDTSDSLDISYFLAIVFITVSTFYFFMWFLSVLSFWPVRSVLLSELPRGH